MEGRGAGAQSFPAKEVRGEAVMVSQDQWGAIRTLKERGVSNRAVARLLGISVTTVRRYLRQGGRRRYERARPISGELEQKWGEYLARRAQEVDFCAQVLFQELREQGFHGSYETVKRWVRPRRAQQRRLEEATVRFETAPGRQGQVDWGSSKLWIAGELQRAHLFVLTLGYSRRLFARAYPSERLASLIDGHERAFQHFGGRTDEVLYDNPRTIVLKRDLEGRHVEWHPVFKDFADYYGFSPRLCRPYRARTKGKVESAVKYVKRNALVGRAFGCWQELNDWLLTWATTIADQRIHGTTHERPLERFAGEALHPLGALPIYRFEREPLRRVANDCLVTLDSNRYSVPWRLVGERVEVAVVGQEVQVCHHGEVVARHSLCHGRHKVIRDAEHFSGLLRTGSERSLPPKPSAADTLWPQAAIEVDVRDLKIYETLTDGGASS